MQIDKSILYLEEKGSYKGVNYYFGLTNDAIRKFYIEFDHNNISPHHLEYMKSIIKYRTLKDIDIEENGLVFYIYNPLLRYNLNDLYNIAINDMKLFENRIKNLENEENLRYQKSKEESIISCYEVIDKL